MDCEVPEVCVAYDGVGCEGYFDRVVPYGGRSGYVRLPDGREMPWYEEEWAWAAPDVFALVAATLRSV